MKRVFFLYVLWFMLGAIFAQSVWGQIPQTISYQGVLKNSDGTIVTDGDYNLSFKLYDASLGGNQLWSETHSQAGVSEGLYHVILGENNSLNLPFDKPYWLSMAVNGEEELSPRIILTASPYSLNAAEIADNTVSTDKVQEGAITSDKIADNQVVKSINTLKDDVTLAAGSNANITTSGNTITIGVSGGIPSGAIVSYAGSTSPTGWLICDGSAVSRTTYADLFSAISTSYGAGDGASTFNLPDLRSRVLVGFDSGDFDFSVLGNTGGEKTHTLSEVEMPSHNHVVDVRFGGDETGSGTLQGAATTTSSLTTKNTGGGQPHNNLQPYIVINFIIKY